MRKHCNNLALIEQHLFSLHAVRPPKAALRYSYLNDPVCQLGKAGHEPITDLPATPPRPYRADNARSIGLNRLMVHPRGNTLA